MNRKQMQGVYVVEFAFIGLLLFTLLFGVLEIGRLYFTVSALDEAVRRGARLAAVCDVKDPLILRRAIFNEAGDSSSLIANLDTGDLTLTYLNENGGVVTSPTDLVSPTGFRAIRYVQLSLQNFTFDLFIPGYGLPITLPVIRATLPRESLGRHTEVGVLPGITPC